MRVLFAVSVLFMLTACNQGSNNNEVLQRRVDSLQQRLADVYRPGLGEFMSGIQMHHAKLWFAGQAQNWKLADFEIHEIMESIDDIKKYNTDRPEVAAMGMIDAAIDSMNNAIENKNTVAFKQGYILLTNTCNNCHTATKHEFNVIVVPETSPVSNQDYSAKQ